MPFSEPTDDRQSTDRVEEGLPDSFDRSLSTRGRRMSHGLARDRPDDPRHELGGAPRRSGRQPRQGVDEVDHVLVRQAAKQVEQAEDRRVGDPAKELQ